MRAAVLSGPGNLQLAEVADPVPRDDEVLVRIHANGICGSDIHFYEDGRLGPYVVEKPYIPGHEACGTVISEPKSVVEAPRIGQRVAIEPGIPCRRCTFCKNGRYNLCTSVRFLSAPPENGTFADMVAMPWDFVHILPDSVDDETGAFVEPVSVAVQACERSEISAGETVLVIGAGPIGLILGLVAAQYGAARIYIADILPHRLALADKLGFDGIFNPASRDIREEVIEVTGGGADIVFDASGSSSAVSQTPNLVMRGGRIVLIGWPDRGVFEFPFEQVLEKELDVRGVNRYCNTYKKSISLMSRGGFNPGELISHRFAFEDIQEAFRFSSENRTQTVKVLISHQK